MEKIREYYGVYYDPNRKRCNWAQGERLIAYHDNEYGVIKTTNEKIFEQLCLEVFGTGRIVPNVIERRDQLREEFCGYDISACAALSPNRLKEISNETAISYAKVCAVVQNAAAAQSVIDECGSLFRFFYHYATPERLLFACKRYGFTQMGVATVTGLMKSLGILQAHQADCYKRSSITEES